MDTFIIAEAGANHNRSFERAICLIDIAKKAGASACKFQTYSSETLYCRNTPDFAGYHNINDLIKGLELKREWQKDLKAHCDATGIEFMSTPFDELAIQQLVDLGVRRIKIAGFESTDPRFLEVAARTKLPLIVSVGIGSSRKAIERIIDISHRYGCGELVLLHANHAYPTPQKDSNLQTILALRETFSVPVGLSDHTLSPHTPAFAVMLGANVIEKHFTQSRALEGPDHPFALEPDELVHMVELIKLAEESRGTRTAKFTESERPFRHACRSVVTTRALRKGHRLAAEDLTTKRPFFEGALPAFEYFNVVGKVLKADLAEDVPVKRCDI